MSTAFAPSTEALTSFNPFTPDPLLDQPVTFEFRDMLFARMANSVRKYLAEYGNIESWLGSVKSMSDEDEITKAVAIAKTLSGMSAYEAGRIRREYRGNIATHPAFTAARRLEKLAVCLREFWKREFDDASFAFYVATVTGLASLDEGYKACESQIEQILSSID